MLALPSLRISGDYLLIASIGFQLGMIELIKNLRFTGGASGVSNIPSFLVPTFGKPAYVALVIAVAVAVVLLVRRIAHSDYGRAISAMRDDEMAFAALGRDAKWMKISLFALGSGIAGLAGALYAHYFRFVTVEQFEILMSSTILTMVVVGGMRTPWGPVVGAILLQALPQAITFLNLPPALLGSAAGPAVHGARADLHVPAARRPGAGRHDVGTDETGRTAGAKTGGALTCWQPHFADHGLNKSFGGIVVADDIDLDMPAGRILGLIGPNGAGKTSLFNLVSGVFPPDSGTVTLDGTPLDGLALHERVRLGLSRTWQHVRLFPSLSVIDNLVIGARDYPGEKIMSVLLRPGAVRAASEAAAEQRPLDPRAHAAWRRRRTKPSAICPTASKSSSAWRAP